MDSSDKVETDVVNNAPPKVALLPSNEPSLIVTLPIAYKAPPLSPALLFMK